MTFSISAEVAAGAAKAGERARKITARTSGDSLCGCIGFLPGLSTLDLEVEKVEKLRCIVEPGVHDPQEARPPSRFNRPRKDSIGWFDDPTPQVQRGGH
jgi:hypothetical protein